MYGIIEDMRIWSIIDSNCSDERGAQIIIIIITIIIKNATEWTLVTMVGSIVYVCYDGNDDITLYSASIASNGTKQKIERGKPVRTRLCNMRFKNAYDSFRHEYNVFSVLGVCVWGSTYPLVRLYMVDCSSVQPKCSSNAFTKWPFYTKSAAFAHTHSLTHSLSRILIRWKWSVWSQRLKHNSLFCIPITCIGRRTQYLHVKRISLHANFPNGIGRDGAWRKWNAITLHYSVSLLFGVSLWVRPLSWSILHLNHSTWYLHAPLRLHNRDRALLRFYSYLKFNLCSAQHVLYFLVFSLLFLPLWSVYEREEFEIGNVQKATKYVLMIIIHIDGIEFNWILNSFHSYTILHHIGPKPFPSIDCRTKEQYEIPKLNLTTQKININYLYVSCTYLPTGLESPSFDALHCASTLRIGGLYPAFERRTAQIIWIPAKQIN